MCPTVSLSSSQWLLAVLRRLDLLMVVGDRPTLMPSSSSASNSGLSSSGTVCCCSSAATTASAAASKMFVLPSLLESGYPSQDVWPDVPEWDEKQVYETFRTSSSPIGVAKRNATPHNWKKNLADILHVTDLKTPAALHQTG